MTAFAPRPTRYHPASVLLHWLMAALLLAIVACVELREFIPREHPWREALKTWHFMLGMTVPLLLGLRLALLAWLPRPAHAPGPWSRLARLMQFALYGLMLALPLFGWLALSARGRPVPFFLGWEWPALVEANRTLARNLKEAHELGANLGMLLVGAHAVAALFHHHILKDDTLRRMGLAKKPE